MINFNDAKFETSIGNLKQLKKDDIPEIVFSGRSNVGKSSLINKILNRKSLARVSNKPGKTININFYGLKGVRFVDLPGYGYARVSFSEKERWAALIEGYFERKKENIKLVIQIVDIRRPPTELDFQMMDFLHHKGYPFIVVASKSDKLNKTQRAEREKLMREEIKDYGALESVIFSSQTGEGVERLKAIISEHSGLKGENKH